VAHKRRDDGSRARNGWQAADLTRVYRVATNNYLAFGASDILTNGANKKDTGLVIRDLMIKEIQRSSPLQRPAAEFITDLPTSKRH